ncbi:MAG: hypothetical protein WC760_09955 [Bacteroidia bacterium]|jgi:hypothetical protein
MENLRQKFCIAVLLLFTFGNISAQSPHKMSYQAVVRNSTFNLVVNTNVGMKISILQGSATGTVVYSETQLPKTNINGLASLEIGSGTVVAGNMATINWGAGPFFIKTETDPAGGTNYTIVSTTQFLSVPYALYAANSGNAATTTGNCMECHVHDKSTTGGTGYVGSLAEKRDNAADSWKYSVHAKGETAMAEGTSSSCSACHAHQGFSYRVANKLQPTFTGTGPYAFSLSIPPSHSSAMSSLPQHIGCFTCHKGSPKDSMALISTDSVKLLFYAMPGKEKFVNLTQDKGKSNLCILCHQARPITQNTTSGNGASLDYPDMATKLTDIFYDSTKTASTGNKVSLSSHTVGHYGWPGNVLAGKGFGAIEIPGGPVAYTNSAHTVEASCINCHMANPKVVNDEPVGSHTFTAAGNFNGCNVTDCHGSSPLSASSAKFVNATKNQKANLDTLAGLLMSKGQYLQGIDSSFLADGTTPKNLWYKFTSLHFTGSLNIGNSAGQFVVNTATIPSGRYKWPTLTNGQFAALQAFSVAIREFSGGIHNTQYTDALLRNSIWYLRANPIP